MKDTNTVFLTFIAIATLLLAVAGSTFAFFTVQERNNADIKVDVTTAKAQDIFTSSGTGEILLDITNDKMLKPEQDVIADQDSETLKVQLTAGSGNASCKYYLTYTPKTGAEYDTYVKSFEAKGFEYTIKGTDGDQSIPETNFTGYTQEFGPFEIKTTTTEIQTWTLTGTFYNLTIDQTKNPGHLDKKYSGNIKVTNVECENTKYQQAN